MKALGKIAQFAALALGFASLALAQTAGTVYLGCSTATLSGTYAFQIVGQILTPAPVAGPVAGVALTSFDGFGNLTQVDNVVHGGIAPAEDWRPSTGTYTVNPNCTGTFTFKPAPTDPKDAGPALTVHFVILQDGSQIFTTVTGSSNTPPFTAAITSIGIRVRCGWDGCDGRWR